MRVIGLTGGIGSGKSTVSNYLKDRGAVILDADKMAREIVRPGSPVLDQLAFIFGKEIIKEDGSLNRTALGSMVFSNKENKEILDRITHGEIKRLTLEAIDDYKSKGFKGLVVMDAALLFEAEMDKFAQEVWVVFSPMEERIKRVMTRDNLTYDQVLSRINSQMSDEERNQRGDIVLNNFKDLDFLLNQVDNLIRNYGNSETLKIKNEVNIIKKEGELKIEEK